MSPSLYGRIAAKNKKNYATVLERKLEMWANAKRDGRPAEYRLRPLFNAAVWLTPTSRVPCSNAAKTRNPLKLPGMPQTKSSSLSVEIFRVA